MAKVRLHTGPGVFAVLANVCRSPQEALKQFVENAADAIDQAKTEEGYIRLKLEYEPADNGQMPDILCLKIEDNGVGMTREKMDQVLHSIGDSEKINLALRGEQGIGLLAFALIAQELHLASTAEEGSLSSCLVLKRAWLKRGYAEIIEHCHAHEHTHRGTIAYLDGILPEIAPQLSKERIKGYLGQQFASDLRANLYAMSISDDSEFEEIHSQHFRGVKVMSTNLPLLRGASAFCELYVLPWEMADATISLYGRRGTRICSLTDLDDFKVLPWLDQRLEGYIRCDRLKRTADKTAVVQDEVYRAFVTALQQLEPKIQQLILEVSAESQERRFNLILHRAGRLIDKFLRYREKGLLAQLPLATAVNIRADDREIKQLPLPSSEAPIGGLKPVASVIRAPTRAPYIKLQSLPQEKADYRSWYDPGQGVICINREHAEFLLSQREDRRCLRYLFSIWAKESLLQEYGIDAEKVADELVGVLAEAEPLLW
ncbi:MAG: ATP-binding protein [Chloroflexi bacterium]|nr:ATP-binding protein [Chloroflexota bacterium]